MAKLHCLAALSIGLLFIRNEGRYRGRILKQVEVIVKLFQAKERELTISTVPRYILASKLRSSLILNPNRNY